MLVLYGSAVTYIYRGNNGSTEQGIFSLKESWDLFLGEMLSHVIEVRGSQANEENSEGNIRQWGAMYRYRRENT